MFAAFVTFSKKEGRDIVIDKLGFTSFRRLLDKIFSCCLNRNSKHHFEGQLLSIKVAEDPGNVLWSNLETSRGEILLRRGVSILLTALLFLLSCIILILATNAKTDFYKKYPTVNCDGRDPTKEQVVTDFNQGSLSIGLLQCYCTIDITGRLYDEFSGVNDGNSQLCFTWLTDRALTYSLTFLIVFGVISINYLVQWLFSNLSKFEKHKSLTEQLSSRVIKVFIAQFLNTVCTQLLIVSTNGASIRVSSFLSSTLACSRKRIGSSEEFTLI